MKKKVRVFCFAGIMACLFSAPVCAFGNVVSDSEFQSEGYVLAEKEGTEVEQASRAAGFIKSAIQMPESGQYAGLFQSVCDENGTYQGFVGKALLFHTGKRTSFYKISETNTYAYSVTFQMFNCNSVGLDQPGMKNQVAADSLAEPVVKLDADTDYYIVMYAQNRKSDETGEASVSLLEIEDDYSDQMPQAYAVGFGRQTRGRLEGYSDKDYFSIRTDEKKAYYKISAQNKSIKRLTVSVYDKNGILLESPWVISDASTKESNLEFAPSSVYYICFAGSEETYLGEYSFSVSREVDDAGDTALDAVNLKMDDGFCGRIQADEDVDMVSFSCGNASVCQVKVTNRSDSYSLKYKIITADGKTLKNGTLEAGLSAEERLRELQKKTNCYVQISGKEGASYKIEISFVRHKITYYLDGGKNNKKNPENYIETIKLNLCSAKRKGYAFCGWSRDKKLTDSIKAIPDTEENSVALYAKWKKIKTGRVQIKSVKRDGKAIRVSYGRVDHAKGYQISYATSKSFQKAKTVTSKNAQKKISGIKKGKNYFVRVRAYRLDSAGKKVYGKWSKACRLAE